MGIYNSSLISRKTVTLISQKWNTFSLHKKCVHVQYSRIDKNHKTDSSNSYYSYDSIFSYVDLLNIFQFCKTFKKYNQSSRFWNSVLYGKTVYCQRSTIPVPRTVYSVLCIQFPLKIPCENICGCENAVKKFFRTVLISIIV